MDNPAAKRAVARQGRKQAAAPVAKPRGTTSAKPLPDKAKPVPDKAKPRQARLKWNFPALTAGVDEAGRGPLAGPVVAAAVILDPRYKIKGLDDSKKLTAKVRERLYDEIFAKALCCSVAQASVEEIETLNILHATMLAMARAVEGLRLKPGKVLVDGNRLPVLKVAAEAVIGGDATVAAIAAASILAKVHRDRLCLDLHEAHPLYGFDEHKGYSTPEHLAALKLHGACAVHRRGFAPVREALATLELFQMPPVLSEAGRSGDGSSRGDITITPDLVNAAFAASRALSESDAGSQGGTSLGAQADSDPLPS
jgi:ribonuclease HII